MVSTRMKKSQKKMHLSQLDETLNDFVIGNGITEDIIRNEGSKLQADGHQEEFGEVLTVRVRTKSKGGKLTIESEMQ